MTFHAEIKQPTTDLHVVPKLRMTGAVPSRPTCTVTAVSVWNALGLFTLELAAGVEQLV